jgi:hypothetical protein
MRQPYPQASKPATTPRPTGICKSWYLLRQLLWSGCTLAVDILNMRCSKQGVILAHRRNPVIPCGRGSAPCNSFHLTEITTGQLKLN